MDPSEVWTPVADDGGRHEASRLFEVFLARWPAHVDATLRTRRIAAWQAMVANVDQVALKRLIAILSRDNPAAVQAALSAARACWADTPWQSVPDSLINRNALWWWTVVDALEQGGFLVSFDWKGFDMHTQTMLVEGIPALATMTFPEPPVESAIGRMKAFDAVLRPLGYRLLSPQTPRDDYTGIVLSEDLASEAEKLAAGLGVSILIPDA